MKTSSALILTAWVCLGIAFTVRDTIDAIRSKCETVNFTDWEQAREYQRKCLANGHSVIVNYHDDIYELRCKR